MSEAKVVSMDVCLGGVDSPDGMIIIARTRVKTRGHGKCGIQLVKQIRYKDNASPLPNRNPQVYSNARPALHSIS